MKPRRFFTGAEPLQPGVRLLTGKLARHLNRVLRLRAGQQIVLFDGSGWEFPAEILEVRPHGVRVQVADGAMVNRESTLAICLGLCLCQPATMDLVVQKATELGVVEIVPVQSERSQRWLRGQGATNRHNRWFRIAQGAARQSGRNRVPRIAQVTDFAQVLQLGADESLKLIFWEEETSRGFKQILAARTHTNQVCVLIGPEGGFTPVEVEKAVTAGFQAVSLGRHVLRVETAVVAVVSLLQFELGDLGL